MASILQRAARCAARRPLARHYATASAYATTPTPIDIDTDPEPLKDYSYAPPISRQYLPPTGWQDLQMRRNFGDPLPEHDELLSMWGPDIPTIEPRTALFRFVLAFSGFAGFFFFVKTVLTPDPHFVRRTYPYGGLVKELGGLEVNSARVEDGSAEE